MLLTIMVTGGMLKLEALQYNIVDGINIKIDWSQILRGVEGEGWWWWGEGGLIKIARKVTFVRSEQSRSCTRDVNAACRGG